MITKTNKLFANKNCLPGKAQFPENLRWSCFFPPKLTYLDILHMVAHESFSAYRKYCLNVYTW